MLHRYRKTLIQRRILVALAFCLLALQFARFEHIHTADSGHLLQDCHICSQIDRLGHAPPAATNLITQPPLWAVQQHSAYAVFYPTDQTSPAQARAPPVYS